VFDGLNQHLGRIFIALLLTTVCYIQSESASSGHALSPFLGPSSNHLSTESTLESALNAALSIVNSVLSGHSQSLEQWSNGFEYKKGVNELQLSFIRVVRAMYDGRGRLDKDKAELISKIKNFCKTHPGFLEADRLFRTPFEENQELAAWMDHVSKKGGVELRKPGPSVELYSLVVVKQAQVWYPSNVPSKTRLTDDISVKYYMPAGSFITDDTYKTLEQLLLQDPCPTELAFCIPSDAANTAKPAATTIPITPAAERNHTGDPSSADSAGSTGSSPMPTTMARLVRKNTNLKKQLKSERAVTNNLSKVTLFSAQNQASQLAIS
jgi:hypothetical protein